jgi:hypothetical protein
MNIIERFSNYLTSHRISLNIKHLGILQVSLKGRNAFYRYDVRDMFKLPDGTPAQKGRLDSKADKMVLEMEDKWVILDLEELHQYIKKNKLTKVYVNDLIKKLEWNIVIIK